MKVLKELAVIAPALLIVALVAAGAAAAIIVPITNGIRADITSQASEIRMSIDRIAQKAYENQGSLQLLSWGLEGHAERIQALENARMAALNDKLP